MPKVTIEIDIKEAKNLIKRMPLESRIKLIKELMKETWFKRIDKIFKKIDTRRKIHKISNKDISQEIEKARKKFHAHSC